MPQLQPGEYTKQSVADLLGWNTVAEVPQPGTARFYYNSLNGTIHCIDSTGTELLPGNGAVSSVNGMIGVVVLTPANLGAVALTAPVGNQTITSSGNQSLRLKSNTSNSYIDIVPYDSTFGVPIITLNSAGNGDAAINFSKNGVADFVFYHQGGATTLAIAEADIGGVDVLEINNGITSLRRLQVGQPGYGITGQITMYGSSSGAANIISPAAQGSPTLTLPTTTGTFALTSDLPVQPSTSYSSNSNVSLTARVVEGTGGSGGITLTVLSASLAVGYVYTLKKVDSGVGAVTIIDGSSANFDGDASYILSDQWQYVTIQWNGTRWNVIGNN